MTSAPALMVLTGPLAGKRFVIDAAEQNVLIGSDPTCAVAIPGQTVSPVHARLWVEAEGITIHGAQSPHGLYVNDDPVSTPRPLRNGDILWLGSPGAEEAVMIQCSLPPPAMAAAAPAPVSAAAVPDATDPAPPPAEAETVMLAAVSTLEPVEEAEPEPELVEAAPVEATLEVVEPAEPATMPAFSGEATIVEEAPDFAATVVLATERPLDATIVEAVPQELLQETVQIAPEAPAAPPAPPRPAPAPPAPAPPAPAPPVVEATMIDMDVPTLIAPPAAVAPPPPPAPAPPAKAAPPSATAAAEPPRPPAPPARPVPAPPPGRPATPAKVARPAADEASRPAPKPSSPRPAAPARRDPPTPRPAAPRPAPEPRVVAEAERPAPAAPRKSGPPVAVLAGAGLLLAGGGFLAYFFLMAPAPAPAPPVAASRPAPPATVALAPTLPAAEPPPGTLDVAPAAPVESAPPAEEPPSTLKPQAAPAATPATAPTRPAPPTTAPKPAEAAAPPTTPPAPAKPTTEAQVAEFVKRGQAAAAAGDFDAALNAYAEALKLDPSSAAATQGRASATTSRDLARRTFVAGKTVVQAKAGKSGGLEGFDSTGVELKQAVDFSGRLDLEMQPAHPKAGETYVLKVSLVNEGKKDIKIQGVALTTTVNGKSTSASLNPEAKELKPQQRIALGESRGAWQDGTTAWSAEVVVTANKGDALKSKLTWK